MSAATAQGLTRLYPACGNIIIHLLGGKTDTSVTEESHGD